jgi:hypothetical protein
VRVFGRFGNESEDEDAPCTEMRLLLEMIIKRRKENLVK